ncbi:MAG: hypothetical protein HYX96_07455 [Chloroflexi bacterium]|nr:hypothetical protein [Chloroflexota bacterium]
MLLSLVYQLLFGMPAAIGKQVMAGLRDEIDRERLITPDAIKLKLQELQIELQDGELSLERYEELETYLIARLRLVNRPEKEEA